MRRVHTDDGRQRCLVVIVRDVTEFKTVEHEVVDVLESMSDAFSSIDKNWIATRVNAQHEKSTVYKREQQVGKASSTYSSTPNAA